jgi:hypothetical protein
VQGEFAAAPPNIVTATSRAIFSHNVTPTQPHQGAIVDDDGETPRDEFGATLNRHAECSDCHNPHNSYIDPPSHNPSTENPLGWTASGRNFATTGVEATYTGVAAGARPTYKLLDGIVEPLTAEYQLCFKCHSSYTTLPSNAGMAPDSMIYDQAVQFNPANPSFHPVTSAGKNQTKAMQRSLDHAAGDKLLWNFQTTDTIRCTNCHADPSVSNANGGAGQNSAPHASYNKYVLLRRYVNDPNTSSSLLNDFDLCFGCHSQGPFVSEGSADTNWGEHAKHVNEEGIGCVECHGTIHSTTNISGNPGLARLIQFGPSATPYNASTPLWTPVITNGVLAGGACALKCHGETHNGTSDYRYTYNPDK